MQDVSSGQRPARQARFRTRRARRNDRARPRRDARGCRLRPAADRPALPGARLGDREREDVRPHRRDERRGERARRSRGPQCQAHEDPRRAARRATPEEHRHHRGESGEGHRQVRETGRRDRLARPDHEPGTDASLHRHLRAEMPGRGDLLAAPALEGHDFRDGARDARGDPAPRRARGSVPVHPESEHPADAVSDGELRPHARDRRAADGACCLQLGPAGLRRRCGQLHDGHRRNCRHRHRSTQHADVEDIRLRLRLLRRRQLAHRFAHLRRAGRRARQGRRVSREQSSGGCDREGHVG